MVQRGDELRGRLATCPAVLRAVAEVPAALPDFVLLYERSF